MIPALAVAAGAVAQAVTGIGFALVAAPFLVAALGPRDGVPTAIALSAVLNVAVLVTEHRHVVARHALALLVPAAAVTPLVAWIVRGINGRVLAALAGALTLAGVAALLRRPPGVDLPAVADAAEGGGERRAGDGERPDPVPTGAGGRAEAVVAGLISATMNVIAGIGGPAASLYALRAGWAASARRATLQAYFLGLNVVALAGLGFPPIDPALVVALLGGWLSGSVLAPRVSEPVARSATLTLAAAGGVAALVRAVVG